MAGAPRSEVAAWRKDNPPPSKVHRAFGGEWDIPASMPASLWFWHREKYVDEGRPITDGVALADLDEAIGILGLDDAVRAWAEGGATFDEVYDEVYLIIVGYLMTPSARSRQGEARRAATSVTSSPPTSSRSPRSPEPRPASTSPTSSEEA